MAVLKPKWKGRDNAVLYLDSQWLKIVHYKGNRKRTVTRVYAQDIQDRTLEEIHSVIHSLCEAGDVNLQRTIIANPSALTTARVLNLPATDSREIAEMIDLQVEKQTPHAREDTLSYHQVLDRDPNGYTRAMLVVTHKDAIDRGLSLVESLGGVVNAACSDLDGINNWFKAVYGNVSRRQGDASLLADIDTESTTIMVFGQSKPYFHRTIPIGYKQLKGTGSEEEVGSWVAEIQRSLETFDSESLGIQCSEILISGIYEEMAYLTKALAQQQPLPVQFLNPFERCSMTEKARQVALDQPKVSFLGPMGLALSPAAGDLTPPAVTLRQSFQKRTKALVTMGGQVLAGLILMTLFFLGSAHVNMQRFDNLTNEYAVTSVEARKIELMLDQLAIAKERISQRGVLLNSLLEINRLTPSQIKWATMTYTESDGLVIKGNATEMPKVFELVRDLEESALFSKPEANRVSKRQVDGESVTGFEIICPIVTQSSGDERS